MRIILTVLAIIGISIASWLLNGTSPWFFLLVPVAFLIGAVLDAQRKNSGQGLFFNRGVETVSVGPTSEHPGYTSQTPLNGVALGNTAVETDDDDDEDDWLFKTLEVIVTGFAPPAAAFGELPANPQHAQGEIHLINLDEELIDALPLCTYEGMPDYFEDFWYLDDDLACFLRDLSRYGPVAFVERLRDDEQNEQRAVVWRNGELIFGEVDGTDTVNTALRMVGVRAEPPNDEFTTLRMERFYSA